MKLTSAAQMREMDRQTIEDYGVPSIVLMENAALRVVEVIAARYAPLAGKRIVVVCGKGNNGGDGLAIARHLATRYNAEVSLWLIADAETLTGDAAINYRLAKNFGFYVHEAGGEIPAGFATALARADIVIDALFGTGIRGGVSGAPGEAIGLINLCRAPVVSVDVPSGLIADTGDVPGPCVRACLTVTFALPKYGLVEYPGIDYVGELVVADIGMPRAVMQAEHVTTEMTEAAGGGTVAAVAGRSTRQQQRKVRSCLCLCGFAGLRRRPRTDCRKRGEDGRRPGDSGRADGHSSAGREPHQPCDYDAWTAADGRRRLLARGLRPGPQSLREGGCRRTRAGAGRRRKRSNRDFRNRVHRRLPGAACH